MREWEFTYEQKPKTPEELRKERRDKAWKEACPKTRQACVQEVYIRTHKGQEPRSLTEEVKGVAIGTMILAAIANIIG